MVTPSDVKIRHSDGMELERNMHTSMNCSTESAPRVPRLKLSMNRTQCALQRDDGAAAGDAGHQAARRLLRGDKLPHPRREIMDVARVGRKEGVGLLCGALMQLTVDCAAVGRLLRTVPRCAVTCGVSVIAGCARTGGR